MGITVGRVKAAIVTGCVVPHDAISNIVRQQADALGRPSQVDLPQAEVRIYALGGAVNDSRLVEVPSAAALAADPFFQSCDVVVFHFGIYYDLFDALHLAPRTARVLAYYHGITPPALCTGPSRETTAKSFRQANHLRAAERVMVTSQFMSDELLRYGVDPGRIVRVPPSVAVEPRPRQPRVFGGPVRFAYVGRFVKPKGVADLLEAFGRFAESDSDATLDLAGSARFSDAAYLAKLQEEVDRRGLTTRVALHLDLPDAELGELLAAADVFVLPSHHEGFGVPIVEALASGCYVLCSDAGACLETVGGLGTVFPAKDVSALTSAMACVADAFAAGERPTAAGTISPEEWHRRATAYAASFSRAAFEDRFRAVCLAGVTPLPASLRTFFADAADGLRGNPHPGHAAAGTAERVYAKFWRLLPASVAERKAA